MRRPAFAAPTLLAFGINAAKGVLSSVPGGLGAQGAGEVLPGRLPLDVRDLRPARSGHVLPSVGLRPPGAGSRADGHLPAPTPGRSRPDTPRSSGNDIAARSIRPSRCVALSATKSAPAAMQHFDNWRLLGGSSYATDTSVDKHMINVNYRVPKEAGGADVS